MRQKMKSEKELQDIMEYVSNLNTRLKKRDL